MKVEDDALLDWFRRRPCEACGWPGPSEASHTFAKGMGGWGRLDVALNLTSLCRRCHQSHHDAGVPSKAALMELAAGREGIPLDELLTTVYLLRRLPDGTDEHPILEALYARYGRAYPRSPREHPDRPADPAGREGARNAGILRRPPVGPPGGVPPDQDGWHHY